MDLQFSDMQSPLGKRARLTHPGPTVQFAHQPVASGSSIPDPDGGPDGSKKNRKRPLSCGECRRLKLKCDRVFPCQSCCKRGCAEICPDGALQGGKGSRFILANTEQLHDKIKTMSTRIRDLEDALQAATERQSHPLLRDDLLLIKKSAELFGVDSHHSNGQSQPMDVGEQYAHDATPPVEEPHSRSPSYMDVAQEEFGIPADLLRISRLFPAPSSISFDLNPSMRQRIVEKLPPQHDALYLCQQAALNGSWHSDGTDGIANMIHSVYNVPVATLNPHRLAYLLMILAIGTSVDQRRDHRTWFPEAERYHHLARASLCETAVIDDPSTDGVNAMFYMSRYLNTFSTDKYAVEYSWTVLGIAMRLAIAVGLHRDTARSKVIPEEIDRRKSLLWCMINVDVRMCMMLRRPPGLPIRYVEVQVPAPRHNASPHESFQAWHQNFTAHCLGPALEATISPNPPLYEEVMLIDARMREFELPDYMQVTPSATSGNQLCLMQCMAISMREVGLLNLHRTYFTQALHEGFWANHRYAASVVAMYQAALTQLWCLETYYRQQPEYAIRPQTLWTNGLSSAVALCLIAARVSPSCMAANALLELGKVLRLFNDVRDRCAAASKAIPILESLFLRSRSAYLQARFGVHAGECAADEDAYAPAGLRSGGGGAFAHMPEVDVALFPVAAAHPALARAFEEAIANVPPPNDAILMPGPIHIAGGAAEAEVTTAGFGVSAERSGLQSGPAGGPTGMGVGMGMGMGMFEPQSLRRLNVEYSDSGWMTWF